MQFWRKDTLFFADMQEIVRFWSAFGAEKCIFYTKTCIYVDYQLAY